MRFALQLNVADHLKDKAGSRARMGGSSAETRAGAGGEKLNLKLPAMRRGEDVVQVRSSVCEQRLNETNVTVWVQEWQQGVAEALKANILNGSTSPTKARASSGKQGMQVRR